MRPRLLTRALLAALTLAVLAACSSAEETITYAADFPAHENVDALVQGSTDVIQGRVLSERSEWINVAAEPSDPNDPNENPALGASGDQPNSEFLFTVYEVQVETSAKGSAQPGDVVLVRQLGGQVGDQIAVATSAVPIEVGSTYVMFLSTMPDGMAEFPNPLESVFEIDPATSVALPGLSRLGAEGARDAAELIAAAGGS